MWQVLIPHDGDGGARGSGVYTDHQVEEIVHTSFRGVVIGTGIGPLDTGLGKERPEGPIGFSHFEERRDRVALSVNLLLNGVHHSKSCKIST